MNEDEMVGCEVKGAAHLLTASSQLNVFDLSRMSALFALSTDIRRDGCTFAIRVLSIAISEKREGR